MLNAPLPRVVPYRYRRKKKSKKTATHRQDVTLLPVAFGIASTARQSPSLRPQSCLLFMAPISHKLSGRPYIQKGRWISPAAFPGPCAAGNLHVSQCVSINVLISCPPSPREPPRPRRNCTANGVAVNACKLHYVEITPRARDRQTNRTPSSLP